MLLLLLELVLMLMLELLVLMLELLVPLGWLRWRRLVSVHGGAEVLRERACAPVLEVMMDLRRLRWRRRL